MCSVMMITYLLLEKWDVHDKFATKFTLDSAIFYVLLLRSVAIFSPKPASWIVCSINLNDCSVSQEKSQSIKKNAFFWKNLVFDSFYSFLHRPLWFLYSCDGFLAGQSRWITKKSFFCPKTSNYTLYTSTWFTHGVRESGNWENLYPN